MAADQGSARDKSEISHLQVDVRKASEISCRQYSLDVARLQGQCIDIGQLQAADRGRPKELLDPAVVYGLSGLVTLRFCKILAAVQALFTALILLVPTRREKRKPRRFVQPGFITAVAVLLALALLASPWTLTKFENSRSSAVNAWQSTFAFGRGLLLVMSLVLPMILTFELALNMLHSPNTTETPNCFQEASPGRLWRWTHLALLQPWHDAQYNVLKDSTFRVYPWINALGWDVIFSAPGVCLFSVLGDTNAREMVQCSLMPWLDDALLAAAHVAEVVQGAADDGLGKGIEVVHQAQACVTSGVATATRKGLGKAQELASESKSRSVA
ncbi:hypothetical protein CERZMDRAFT_84176 [Cercospora zeae-maydis SCOH1-5]|uniref:Uncharacterized protein n=1 Tax=Cercospora zeae-maydis SCOH1-5 TaxID=717836 RepID=A0A6A6FIT6_9PEZI|nr:hypothetical protein CERZMDRAFT_84176 [Cercospora zeae-maydis SCOH1-5]